MKMTSNYLKKMLMAPQLDRHSKSDPNPEMLSAVYSGNRIPHDKRNVHGIGHAHMFRNDNILGKDNKTNREWGKAIMGLGATLPNHIPACRSAFV